MGPLRPAGFPQTPGHRQDSIANLVVVFQPDDSDRLTSGTIAKPDSIPQWKSFPALDQDSPPPWPHRRSRSSAPLPLHPPDDEDFDCFAPVHRVLSGSSRHSVRRRHEPRVPTATHRMNRLTAPREPSPCKTRVPVGDSRSCSAATSSIALKIDSTQRLVVPVPAGPTDCRVSSRASTAYCTIRFTRGRGPRGVTLGTRAGSTDSRGTGLATFSPTPASSDPVSSSGHPGAADADVADERIAPA